MKIVGFPPFQNLQAQSLVVNSAATLGSSTTACTINPSNTTFPGMPAFLVVSTATQTNVTGETTAVTVQCGMALFDRTNSYSTSAFAFTAPVTGIYDFSGVVSLQQLSSQNTIASVTVIVNSTRVFTPNAQNLYAYAISTSVLSVSLPWSLLVDVSSGQTVEVQAQVSGQSANVDIVGGSSLAPITWFSGRLLG